MKKQGAFYLKLLSISLAGLTGLFLLLHLLGGRKDYRLQEVIYCEVGDGFTVSGFVVREEQLLLSRETFLDYTVSEGQWLSGGQSYARSYCCAGAEEPTALLYAGSSGYFSPNADGFEGILSYEVLQEMSPRAFALLQGIQTGLPGGTAGKLVRGQTWYFAALLPKGIDYKEGQSYALRFSELGQAAVQMTLCHLSPEQEGLRLGIFSCSQGLRDIINCRRLTAEIVERRLSGLQVPKEALYHLEGETGVYVLVGQRAKWKKITILKDLGEAVLAEDSPADLSSLRKEDELIITTQEIENGKVIR